MMGGHPKRWLRDSRTARLSSMLNAGEASTCLSEAEVPTASARAVSPLRVASTGPSSMSPNKAFA